MVRLLPCSLYHLTEIDYGDEAERRQIIERLSQNSDAGSYILPNIARTIVEEAPDHQRILACFGFWPMWPGAVRAWTMLTDEVLDRRPLTLHRIVKGELQRFTEAMQLRRIEAVVRHDHQVGHRWIQRLGFKWEGLMRKYGINGEDFDLYARCP